jgi:hypothetical protein
MSLKHRHIYLSVKSMNMSKLDIYVFFTIEKTMLIYFKNLKCQTYLFNTEPYNSPNAEIM